MNKKHFLKILKKYRSGTASDEEQRFIELYYDLLGSQEDTGAEINEEVLENEMLYNVWEKIRNEERGRPLRSTNKLVIYRKAVAVALVLMVTGMMVYLLRKSEVDQKYISQNKSTSILSEAIKPAGKKAILTLANGKKVALGEKVKNGLNKTGIKNIYKQDTGVLIYERKGNDAAHSMQYNTLTTPRGGEFKIILADGTKVWLNAGSSLHYPVAFRNKNRIVRLQGEAYFEVAPQKDHPFIVKTGKGEIQVLGTHFNVKAYTEDPVVKTTLMEGSIRVVKGKRSRLLQPGEQAVVENNETGGIAIKQVDVKTILAWKNDLFYFDHTNLKDIMNELVRWYDVSVTYKTEKLKKLSFSGVMSRYADIRAILDRLSLTGTVHFKIDGRNIIVME